MQSSSKLPSPSNALRASRRITKRYSKAQLKRIQKTECKRLKQIIPSVARQSKVRQVTVIEEAIKHIADLEQAILQRLQPPTLSPPTENTTAVDATAARLSEVNSAKSLISSLLPPNFFELAFLSRTVLEKPVPKMTFPLPHCRPGSLASSAADSLSHLR